MSEPFRPAHPGFLVWNPERSYPRVAHARSEEAIREAQRLARENPGQAFYVVAPIGMAHAPVQQPAFHAMNPLAMTQEDRDDVFEREIPF